MSTLSAENLRKVFPASGWPERRPETVALDEVSVAIPAGRLTALIGPNGAGKTTLLRLFAGVLLPTGGRLLTPSSRVIWINALDRHYERLTGAENLEFLARLALRPPAAIAESAARVGLTPEMLAKPVWTYSTGMRGRLSLARAFWPAETVLVDEPTRGMDAAGRETVLAALKELASERAAVVIATHDPAAVAAADTLIALARGRVFRQGEREQTGDWAALMRGDR